MIENILIFISGALSGLAIVTVSLAIKQGVEDKRNHQDRLISRNFELIIQLQKRVSKLEGRKEG